MLPVIYLQWLIIIIETVRYIDSSKTAASRTSPTFPLLRNPEHNFSLTTLFLPDPSEPFLESEVRRDLPFFNLSEWKFP